MSPPSLALGTYLALSHVAGLAAPWVLRRRRARGKEDPARMTERLGHPGLPRPDGPLVWIHGASVGEAISVLPVIAALRAAGRPVLLTTGTVTSARRVAPLLPEGALHQFVPVDTAGAVARFLGHWRPDLGIWVESELWPRLVVDMAATGRPLAMINARLSATSAQNWQRVPAMARRLVRSFAAIETQDDETRVRLGALGADPNRVRLGGNLKAAVTPPGCSDADLRAAQAAIGGRPVWLAASTHAGEETAAARAHAALTQLFPGLLTIIAPRHPERADAIAAELGATGPVARRSLGEVPGPDTAFWLADTLGELGIWYRQSPVAFVGGSLVPRGGHTPFEPIPLGAAVLHGPHVENFAPVYAALDAAGGAGLTQSAGLADAVAMLLTDPAARARMQAAARDVHQRLRPDVDALVGRLTMLGTGT